MPLFDELSRVLAEEGTVAQLTVVSEPGLGSKLLVWPDGRHSGSLGSGELDRRARAAAQAAIEQRRTGSTVLEPGAGGGTEVELFIEVFVPPPKLVVVGAVHVAIALVGFANTLGFRTVVVDARAAFATEDRFPHADELIVGWPGEVLKNLVLHDNSYVVFLSHDAKLDNPGLEVALASAAPYVGALGSKKTHAKRVEALTEMGVDPEAIGRIHAPIGIHLGGRKPEEIALSIAAQIVQARHGLA